MPLDCQGGMHLKFLQVSPRSFVIQISRQFIHAKTIAIQVATLNISLMVREKVFLS